MSGAALMALMILCFAGGYILVNSLFEAFGKKKQALDRHWAALQLTPGASREQIEEAYRTQRDKYAALAESDLDQEMRAMARRKATEVEEAYARLRDIRADEPRR